MVLQLHSTQILAAVLAMSMSAAQLPEELEGTAAPVSRVLKLTPAVKAEKIPWLVLSKGCMRSRALVTELPPSLFLLHLYGAASHHSNPHFPYSRVY